MAVDYKRYLAENVLSERRTVTYRSLGRALKVHSHLAKQMLYEFHRTENAKKPQSVNATYIITGVQHPPEERKPATNGTARARDGDDEVMQSSPFLSSSMPQQDVDAAEEPVRRTSVLLVREEDMEEAKATFQSISSIHIYSLQPTILQDLNVLTDVSREMLATHGNEDPLEYGKHWGMIQNRNVKRRTGAAPAKPAASKSAAAAKQPSPKEEPSKLKKESESEEAGSKAPSRPSDPPKESEKPAASKQKSGGLFASFAKAKPKQKKEETATPAASGAESAEPSGPEDVALDDDDSEEEREDLFLDVGKRVSNKSRESRKEREEKLRKMMEEDDDEDMPDAPETPAEPAAEEPAVEEPKPAPPAKQELKEEVTVQGGRRRGRRQVMKKRTMKDEEGYLVTVEEPVWESFSEDEPAPPPKKKPAVSGASKGKGAKGGQGSITSFFAKKT